MKQRILVAGARGFIGRALLQALHADERWEIHAVTSRPVPSHEAGGVIWHQADLLNPDSVDRIFDALGPTHLMQLAWCADHGTYWRDPANFDWLKANLHIARAFVRGGGKRCVFTGTSAEYDWSVNEPLHEFDSPLKPQLLYGACKLAAYWAMHGFFEQERVSWVWARFFCPFGPHEDPRRLIPKTCLRLLSGEKLALDAAQSLRDFLHIDDVASALVSCIESIATGPVNVASGEPMSIRELVSRIARCVDREDRISFAEPEGGDTPPDSLVADITRLKSEIGWAPTIPFNDRLRQACDWWKANSRGAGN